MNTKKLRELYTDLQYNIYLNTENVKFIKERHGLPETYKDLEKHIELEKKQLKLLLQVLNIENEKKAL